MPSSTVSTTLLRHWAMLALIPTKTWISTPEIVQRLAAQGYAVTPRAVQSDLGAYCQLPTRFPIEVNTTSKPYQYRWKVGAKIQPIPAMDLQTAVALETTERLLPSLLPASTTDHLAPYFKHARAVLDDARRARHPLASWPGKVHVVRESPLRPFPVDARVLKHVAEALERDRCVKLEYRARNAEVAKKFTASPLGLIFSGSRVALVVCRPDLEGEARDSLRTLLLHRTVSAKVAPAPRYVPPGFDLARYATEGHHAFQLGPPIRLRALVRADAIASLEESSLSDDQALTLQPDGRWLLEATVAHTFALRVWILGFGEAMEVIEPRALREDLGRKLREAAARYPDVG